MRPIRPSLVPKASASETRASTSIAPNAPAFGIVSRRISRGKASRVSAVAMAWPMT